MGGNSAKDSRGLPAGDCRMTSGSFREGTLKLPGVPMNRGGGYRANLKMLQFLTVAAKYCRKAEHSLQRAAGSFNKDRI